MDQLYEFALILGICGLGVWGMTIWWFRSPVDETEVSARTADPHSLFSFAEHSRDTICRYDLAGNCIYANPAFHHLATLFSFQGFDWALSGYCGPDYMERISNALTTGQEDDFECQWRMSSGEARAFHIRVVPELASDGRIVSVFAVGHDISAFKETESRLRESSSLLRELTNRLEVAELRGRKQIAHEIHEEHGQLLSALRMRLASMRMSFGGQHQELKQSMQASIEILDESISKMRKMVSDIHPPALDMGVSSALRWLADEIFEGHAISYHVHIRDEAIVISPADTQHIYKIVQLALSNIVRHADAHNVSITLERQVDNYRLEIKDDGKGFDLDRPKHTSLGLVAMEELSNQLRGEIVFMSEVGKGALVEVCFPINSKA